MAFAAGLILAVALGTLFRAPRIAAKPLWLDEAYSAYAAAGGWRFLWQVVPTYEVHPPFYYSLLRLWSLVFGDTVLGLRLLGLACGLATLLMAPLIARRTARLLALGVAHSRWLVVAFTLILAVSPALVMMTREVRTYAVMVLVYALGLLFALRAGEEAPRGPLRPSTLAGFFLCEALMLWLHNLGPLFGFALALALLALCAGRIGRGDWLRIFAGHVVAGLIYLPALLIALDQAGEWSNKTWLRWQPGLLGMRLSGLYATPWWPAWSIGLIAVIGGFTLLMWQRPGRRVALALAVLGLTPPLIAILVSATVMPIFIPRIMSPTIVPFALLAAVPVALAPRWWRAAVLVLALIPIADMANLSWRIMQSRPRQNWTRVVEWLGPRLNPGDIVLSYPNESALAFDRAARDAGLTVDSRPIPGPVPARLEPDSSYSTGSRGVVLLRRPRLRAIARSPEIHAAPTIWLLRLGGSAYDINDVFLNELDDDGRTKVGHYRQGAIDLTPLRRNDLLAHPQPVDPPPSAP